jgi:hypothetical protein
MPVILSSRGHVQQSRRNLVVDAAKKENEKTNEKHSLNEKKEKCAQKDFDRPTPLEMSGKRSQAFENWTRASNCAAARASPSGCISEPLEQITS